MHKNISDTTADLENIIGGDRRKIYLLSLGCSKNLVDAECMSELLRHEHHILNDNPESADVIIVNTCGFIASAKEEAITSILDLADYKKPHGNADFLIVTGCLSQRYAKEILDQMPEVDAVLGTADYNLIALKINDLYRTGKRCIDLPGKAGSLDHLSVSRQPSTPGSYAYIKIAEGCSNRCSYCAIPGIRGDFVSRRPADIISEAKQLGKMGYREIILIAQDTTRYGLDLTGRRMLPELLRSLCNISEIRLIRILYVYADGITDELIEVMSSENKIAHYLDMPVQHGSDRILKKMNRHDTVEDIMTVISKLRSKMPDIILRSTVMVGFPGELSSDFSDLMSFLKQAQFDRLGCFVFSSEEGTPAYEYKPKVRSDVSKRRYDKVMILQQQISLQSNLDRIGTTVPVTLESIDEDGIFYIGRSYGEAPDVDPIIYVAADNEKLELGQTCNVRILDAGEYDLTGVTVT